MQRTRALAVLVLLFLVACQTVAITGRRTLSLLSESKELQMGLSAYQEILEKSKVSTDRAPVDQVTRVGRRIATATGRDDFEWEFKQIEGWLPEALTHYRPR